MPLRICQWRSSCQVLHVQMGQGNPGLKPFTFWNVAHIQVLVLFERVFCRCHGKIFTWKIPWFSNWKCQTPTPFHIRSLDHQPLQVVQRLKLIQTLPLDPSNAGNWTMSLTFTRKFMGASDWMLPSDLGIHGEIIFSSDHSRKSLSETEYHLVSWMNMQSKGSQWQWFCWFFLGC